MKITICRCPVCGSANIASLAWVNPNKYVGGTTCLSFPDCKERERATPDCKEGERATPNDFAWADRDECVYCEDCGESSDYWDETQVEGIVESGAARLADDDGALVSIERWCRNHAYDTDEEEDGEEE